MHSNGMYKKFMAAVLAAFAVFAPGAAQAQAPAANLSGRILSAHGGLPVQNAAVELDRNQQAVASTKSDANGFYTFKGQPEGEYSVLVVASGFEATRIPQVFLLSGTTVQLQTAIVPSDTQTSNLKTIATVMSSGRSSLQTSTTINAYVDPSQVLNLGYAHTGFLLARVPGINMHTSPSAGDDMSIGIRGYDPSETAALLDDHPIGPIGAFGGANSPGFDYKLAPFYGLSNTSVIFGSGAAGLYGTSTIAGAVNFETLNPTREEHWSLTQGIGNYDHSLSGLQTTGTAGKLGYAFAGAVQGTTGQFPGGGITQWANMQVSAYCNAPGGPTCTSGGSPVQPGDLTAQNRALNTYYVSGAYTDKNLLSKLVYSFSPRTQLLASVFDTTSWNDKTGNGDQDAQAYPYVLTQVAPPLEGQNFLYNGAMTACSTSTIPVLVNTAAGYTCLTAQQYANDFQGPYGGGIGRWNASHMQDYHARLTQEVGKTQLIVDGFANNYNMDEHKSPTGPFFEDNYLTHGLLLSDEFQLGNQDISFGYYGQHQRHASATNRIPSSGDSANGSFYLTSDSYFVRDAAELSPKLTAFVNLWEQHSVDTRKNNFDPRVTLLFHATTNDVLRLTAGRSYSEPDPALLNADNLSLSAPLSVNPAPGGELTPVGQTGNPLLAPETATDEEIAYGHRFNRAVTLQLDAYNSLENNAILSSVVPVSSIPQFLPQLQAVDPSSPSGQTFEQEYLARIGPGATIAQLGWSTNANAAQAIYRGVNAEVNANLFKNFTADVQYGVQSAFYRGLTPQFLQNNIFYYNDSQFAHIPLQKAFGSLVYHNGSGIRAEFDETYIASNNEFLQPPFWYADGSLSKSSGPVTVTLGLNNIFNSATTTYGEYGQGQFVPTNQYGSFPNAIAEGGAAELYGLLPRSVFLTVTIRQ